MSVVRLILVRHGHAGRKEQWDKPDELRPLTIRGLRQAKRLVGTIAPLQPSQIISSPHLRCIQTVEPLSSTTGLPIERSPALAPDAPDAAMSLVRKLSATGEQSGVVLCTHGEIMGSLLKEMATENGVELERRPPGLKGCTWLLDFEEGALRTALYVPPR